MPAISGATAASASFSDSSSHVVALGGLDPDIARAQREHAPVLVRAEPGGKRRVRGVGGRGRAHEEAAARVEHLEGDLGLVVVAQRAGFVVRGRLERPWEGHHDGCVRGRGWRLRRVERREHPRGGREPRVEELVRLVLAACEADPGGDAEHGDEHGDAAAEQYRAHRARLQGARVNGGSAT